jgi:hypothetical protein
LDVHPTKLARPVVTSAASSFTWVANPDATDYFVYVYDVNPAVDLDAVPLDRVLTDGATEFNVDDAPVPAGDYWFSVQALAEFVGLDSHLAHVGSFTVSNRLDNPVNHTPLRWQDYRAIIYTPDPEALNYNVYVFDSLEAAIAGTVDDAVAVSRGVTHTAQSSASGGTTMLLPPVVADGDRLIDVRLLRYDNLNGSDATRDLPQGYIPGGRGDSYFAGNGLGDTTNLRPGQYWFRIQAVARADSEYSDSGLSNRIGPFTVTMGPDEARDLIEARRAEIGNTPAATLRLIDLRGPAEFAQEGNVRFFDDRRLPATFNANQAAAEAIFGHEDDKDAVTILLL